MKMIFLVVFLIEQLFCIVFNALLLGFACKRAVLPPGWNQVNTGHCTGLLSMVIRSFSGEVDVRTCIHGIVLCDQVSRVSPMIPAQCSLCTGKAEGLHYCCPPAFLAVPIYRNAGWPMSSVTKLYVRSICLDCAGLYIHAFSLILQCFHNHAYTLGISSWILLSRFPRVPAQHSHLCVCIL